MMMYAVIFVIFAAGAFAQSVTGFGFALVTVPLLALCAGPHTAVIAAGLVGLVLTGTAMARECAYVHWRPAGRLLLAAAVGMPFGLLALTSLSSGATTALIASVTIAATVLVWRGWRIPATAHATAAAGVACGVLTTATGTSGPPLVAALQAMGLTPRAFRATLAAVFTGVGLVSVAGFAVSGMVTGRVGTVAAIGLPACAVGVWAGNRLVDRIDTDRFRKIVIGTLLASSTVALMNALAS